MLTSQFQLPQSPSGSQAPTPMNVPPNTKAERSTKMTDPRLDDLVDDVREIRKDLAEVARCLGVVETYGPSIEELKGQMKEALIPIQFSKWLLVICGGLATIYGAFYGVAKVLFGV